MKNLRYIIGIVAIFWSTFSFAQDNYTVIVNPSGDVSQMSMATLRKYIKGETTRWDDGKKVVIALINLNSEDGQEVSQKIFNKSAKEVNKHYMTLAFQGKISPPKFFNTVQELKNFVQSNPGAIGIIPEKDAAGVKIVLVDGNKSF